MNLEPSEPITRKTRSDKLADSRKVRHRRAFPFVAWDGEGYTRNGKHHYSLFGNSNGDMVRGESLTYADCIPLLLSSPKNAIHVIFAGTYDVTMMFRGTKQIQSIMKGQWVSVGRYRLRFLRGKSLTVKDSMTGESRTLYDVFTFFGTSFVKACQEYLDETELVKLADIERMKLQRAEFDKLTPEIVEYMKGELELLVKLATTLRERLAAVGIYPSRWHGPGAVASTVLKDQRIREHKGEQTQDLTLAAEAAYYGGRFEMFKRGTHVGSTYQYDIRSAYPNAMRLLPSLDVEWRHRNTGNIRVTQDFALYRVKLRNLLPHQTVPHRTIWGAIYYPDWADGWYWGVELPTGSKAIEAYEPDLCPGPSPFSFVEEYYDRRAKLKADNRPEQLALKLALNSLYGKLAQSKGSNWNGKRWEKPTYHQVLWAGFITAHTRSLISHAMELAGDGLIAVETDAVFTTGPLDLPLGTGLGQWDCTEYEGIKYIQSGVHMTLKDGTWSYKTRGVTMRRNQSESSMWDALLSNGSITIKQTRFGTDPRQQEFGRWYTQDRRLVLDHPEGLEKRMAFAPCDKCKIPPDMKLTRKSTRKYLSGFLLDYDTHLHPLTVPPIPRQASTPYRFVWNQDHLPDSIDDPTLYLEYQPETIREEITT